MSVKIKLHYVITNGGDGSASVHFIKSNKLARIFDEFSQYYNEFEEDEYFEEDLEFDEEGTLLDKCCTNVEAVIRSTMQFADNQKYKYMCKKWLEEIEREA